MRPGWPPTPNELDPTGQRFAFELGASKSSGGQGWADVAKLGYFDWEYKGKEKNLEKAYNQLAMITSPSAPATPAPRPTPRGADQIKRRNNKMIKVLNEYGIDNLLK